MPSGVIAAGDPQTAEAGAAMLRAGGNAVDAIVAAAFASFVCEPTLGSPAGAGVLLSGSRDAGFEVLDFFATTPGKGQASWPDLDFFGAEVDFGATTQVFHIGRGSATVPSAAFGLLEAHRRGGSLPLADVVAPAIALARHGYTLSKAIQWVFVLLEPILTHSDGVRRIYCEGDGLASVGAVLTNPPLADFFEQLAVEGVSLLRGPFTDAVLREFGPGTGGMIGRADLEAYAPVVRKPLAVPFHGRTVLTNPPPSSGGGLIGLGLRVAEQRQLHQQPWLGEGHARAVADLLSVISEVRRAGYDARIREPGTVEELLAQPSVARWSERHEVLVTERALGGTTHISVLDALGGAAALTVTNGEGCGHVLPEYGIHMNNFLGEEDINPLGFHQFAPGTWMTTMMSPTIVLDDAGHPELVLGSGGSNRIRSVVLQALLNVLAWERPLSEAVAAPRVHVEAKRLWFEALGHKALGFTEAASSALAWPDHARFDAPNMFFGGVHAVRRVGRHLRAHGDARRGGASAHVDTAD